MKNKPGFFRFFSRKEDVWVVLGLILFDIGVIALPFSRLFVGMDPDKAEELEYILHGVLISAGCWWMILRMGLGTLGGTRFWNLRKPVLLLIPVIYPGILLAGNYAVKGPVTPDYVYVTLGFLACYFKALSEEMAFRGLLQSYLLRKYHGRLSFFKILMLGAIPFSLMHLLNIGKMDWVSVSNQVILAFSYGVFSGALLLLIRNIWVLGLVHGMVNFSSAFPYLVKPEQVPVSVEVPSFSEGLPSILLFTLLFSGLLGIGYLLIKSLRVEQLVVVAPVAPGENGSVGA